MLAAIIGAQTMSVSDLQKRAHAAKLPRDWTRSALARGLIYRSAHGGYEASGQARREVAK